MIDMNMFGKELERYGFNFYSGVPCSFLKSMINYAINEDQFIMSANEGDAVATCAGAYLGGKKTVFLCQNSGLTNAVSPLTSLNHTFNIPVLGFVSLRGEVGIKDEPQHELMGRVTEKLLDTMEIHNEVLSDNFEKAREQLNRANEYIEQNKSFFFIVKKDTLGEIQLQQQEVTSNIAPIVMKREGGKNTLPTRLDTLRTLQSVSDIDTLLLATTGVTGRELYELDNKPNQFYMVGSMGCVSSIALGLALARPDKKVIAIDGDGAFLMRMGAVTSNGYYSPPNLYHLLLDNGMHESTGGQVTVSANVDYAKIAEGSGYSQVETINNLNDLKQSINEWRNKQKLTFAYLKIKQGVKENLGRPKETPDFLKKRFIKYISGDQID